MEKTALTTMKYLEINECFSERYQASTTTALNILCQNNGQLRGLSFRLFLSYTFTHLIITPLILHKIVHVKISITSFGIRPFSNI